MARSTIAQLEAQNARLKVQIANVAEFLIDAAGSSEYSISRDDIIETVAETLDLDLAIWQDVVWNVTIRGRVKISNDADLNDLTLESHGREITCLSLGVADTEYQDISVDIDDVFFD